MPADIEAQAESINPDALKLALQGTLQAMTEANDDSTAAARDAVSRVLNEFDTVAEWME
jgi:hypothetical protein